MTTSPRLGFTYLDVGETIPEVAVNETDTILEAFANAAHFKSRSTAAEPGSPSDGDMYLLTGSPTGTNWSGNANKIALFLNTAWIFRTPKEGWFGWVDDENTIIAYDGAAWVANNGFGGGVSTQSGTSYTAGLGDANTYILFTNGSSITFTIPPNASVAFPVGTVIEMEQNGAGALSVAAGSGVTVNSRGADLTLAGQYAVAAVKKVATNTWTLTGDL